MQAFPEGDSLPLQIGMGEFGGISFEWNIVGQFYMMFGHRIPTQV